MALREVPPRASHGNVEVPVYCFSPRDATRQRLSRGRRLVSRSQVPKRAVPVDQRKIPIADLARAEATLSAEPMMSVKWASASSGSGVDLLGDLD